MRLLNHVGRPSIYYVELEPKSVKFIHPRIYIAAAATAAAIQQQQYSSINTAQSDSQRDRKQSDIQTSRK